MALIRRSKRSLAWPICARLNQSGSDGEPFSTNAFTVQALRLVGERATRRAGFVWVQNKETLKLGGSKARREAWETTSHNRFVPSCS